MERGPLPQTEVTSRVPAVMSEPSPVGEDGAWRFLVLLFTCTVVTIAAVYALWRLLLKDVCLTYKARRQRTVTEIGFGQTPDNRRNTGAGVQQVGLVGQLPG
ncbi:movement protein [Brachypodium phoenicoides associated virus 2]|nr:movement protein [Brachypodium phoenicoides associated virus 2]